MSAEYVTKEKYDEMIQRHDEQERSFGKLNFYSCRCGWFLITIDSDAGVTPAFLMCDNPGHEDDINPSALGASMSSAFYRPPINMRAENASHEWFRPSYDDYRRIVHAPTADYIAGGGLLFRKIGSARVESHDIIFGE